MSRNSFEWIFFANDICANLYFFPRNKKIEKIVMITLHREQLENLMVETKIMKFCLETSKADINELFL